MSDQPVLPYEIWLKKTELERAQDAFLAELAAAMAGRDTASNMAAKAIVRAGKAEAEVARLREALERIQSVTPNKRAHGPEGEYPMALLACQDIARAALAPTPAATPAPDPLDVCECGHGRLAHGPLCFLGCPCPGFRPKRAKGQG